MLIPVRCRHLLLGILVWCAAEPPLASSQDSRLPRDEYFRLIGRYDDFAGIHAFLEPRLANERPDLPEDRRRQMSEFFAFVLTASGLNPAAVSLLEAEGIDIIHAITADTRPFSEQSLLADLVLVGDIIETEVIEDREDGYYASALVDTRWVLKGHPPGDTVVVRLREPRPNDRRDLRPAKGQSYLLLLSNGMYRYAAANHAARNKGWLPSHEGLPYYSIYRIYSLVDGRIDWRGYTLRETETALEDIRRIDHLLNLSVR